MGARHCTHLVHGTPAGVSAWPSLQDTQCSKFEIPNRTHRLVSSWWRASVICALAWTFTTSLQTSQASEDSALPSTQDRDIFRFGGINLEETKLIKTINRGLCVYLTCTCSNAMQPLTVRLNDTSQKGFWKIPLHDLIRSLLDVAM